MILIIDTSKQTTAKLALCRNDQCLEKTIDLMKDQSEGLIKELAEMLKDYSIDLKDIRGIAFCEGPGSFTSLRLGATMANVLAWSLNIPVVTFTKGPFSEVAHKTRVAIRHVHHFTKPALPKYPRLKST